MATSVVNKGCKHCRACMIREKAEKLAKQRLAAKPRAVRIPSEIRAPYTEAVLATVAAVVPEPISSESSK